MKIEFLYQYRKRHGLGLKDKLIANLPRYAPLAARFGWLLNLRDRVPGLAAASEKLLGLSARRSLPRWRTDWFDERREGDAPEPAQNGEVVLYVDPFNRYFEPDNVRAARTVLEAAGYRVVLPRPADGGHPLTDGRTFLAVGLVDAARAEARRLIDAVKPLVERGVAVVGLEPSCLLTLRDEFESMLPGADTEALAGQALLFEEFVAREHEAGRFRLELNPLQYRRALVHGHCHQKAFATMAALERTLVLIPGLEIEVVDSSCCGMAGAFGYEAGHYEVSMRMAEAALLPAVRAAGDDTLLVANGTSCRQQIHDGAARDALHVARLLQMALNRSAG